MSALPTQERTDAELEQQIDAAYERMITADTPDGERNAWTDMAVLIRRRSSTQIMKMELQMRLLRQGQK